MEKFVNKLSDLLMPFADFMNSNKIMTTIRDAFVMYMPLIMVGSFANLFASLLCSPKVGLAAVSGFGWLQNLAPAFNALNFATTNCMALIIVAIIGGLLGKANGMKPYICAGIAFCCYVSLIPNEVVTKVGEAESVLRNTIQASNFNAAGLFLAFVVGITSIELFSFLMGFDKIKIKMPKEVPSGISGSFNSLIPAAIVLFAFTLIGGAFKGLTGMYINQWFYNTIQAPFLSLGESLGGLIVIVLMSQILWWFGVHGNMAMSAVTDPIMIASLAANIEAVNNGGAATHWLTRGFNVTFLAAGGSGIVLSLILCLLTASKRKEYKEVSKVCLLPALFSISEPAVFGLPIVLNPVFLIPFVLSPLLAGIFGYVISKSGWLACSLVDTPFGLPVFIRPLLAYQSFRVILVCAVVFVIAYLVYLPFVLLDNKMYEREQKQNEKEATE